MKRFRFFLLLAISVLALTLFPLLTKAANPVPGFYVSIDIPGSHETFRIQPDGDCIYLPNTADPSSLRIFWDGNTVSYTDKQANIIGDCEPGDNIDLSPALTRDTRGNPCYDVIFTSNAGISRYRFYYDTELPVVYIETSKGLDFIEASKDNRDKQASIWILDENGKTEYSDRESGTESEIKGRGNATWTYYKRPYQIKLSGKQSLFGMDSAKTWILLANYVDQSQLHNALAFEMGDALEIPYNICYRYVNLYIDGSYRGLYLLCEKVQIGSGRIDIHELEKDNEEQNPDIDLSKLPIRTVTQGDIIENSILTSFTYTDGMKTPDNITGGYLVELDNVWGDSEPSRFTTENGNTYVVKSPEYASREEMEYIAELFADMEEAIYSKDGYNRKGIHYSEYIDMDSFAGVYAVEELLKNWDGYLSSMFFYKDADEGTETAKIYMGPLWDLDNILGNLSYDTYATDTDFLWAQNGQFSGYTRALAAPLMRHDDFSSLVAEKIDFLYVKTQEYLSEDGFINQLSKTLSTAVEMDRIRWKLYDSTSWVLNANGSGKVSTKFVHFSDYGDGMDEKPSTALGYLRWFLSERAESLVFSIGGGTLPPVPEQTTTESTVPTETTHSTQTSETNTESSTELNTDMTETNPSPTPQNTNLPFIVPIVLTVIAVGVILIFILRNKKKRKG